MAQLPAKYKRSIGGMWRRYAAVCWRDLWECSLLFPVETLQDEGWSMLFDHLDTPGLQRLDSILTLWVALFSQEWYYILTKVVWSEMFVIFLLDFVHWNVLRRKLELKSNTLSWRSIWKMNLSDWVELMGCYLYSQVCVWGIVGQSLYFTEVRQIK